MGFEMQRVGASVLQGHARDRFTSRHRLGVVLAGVLLAQLVACAQPARPAAPTAEPNAQAGTATTPNGDEGVTVGEPETIQSEIASETPADVPPIAAIAIHHTRGRSPDEFGRIFAPAQERVTECAKPGTGGTVVVGVQRDKNGSTALNVRPGASIGPNERRCVLEALSTMAGDEDLNRNPGPTPLSGFSSMVTISW